VIWVAGTWLQFYLLIASRVFLIWRVSAAGQLQSIVNQTIGHNMHQSSTPNIDYKKKAQIRETSIVSQPKFSSK
jgi:hypothetical protein